MKRTLFDHDTTVHTAEPGDNLSAPNTESFSDRGLVLSKPGDIVMLHEDDYKHAGWLIKHHQAVGLETTDLVMPRVPYHKVTNFRDYRLSTFIFNEDAHSAQPDPARLAITKSLDSKNEFIGLCEDLNIPTAKTWRYHSKDQMSNLRQITFPCYLKISTSLAGNGVFRCKSRLELVELLELVSSEIKFQVQEDMVTNHNAITFLNLQCYEENGQARRLLLTDQVLNGNVHVGNRYLNSAAIEYEGAWSVVEPLAKHAVANGIKGIFAFDVAVCRNLNGQLHYLPVECNPRPNGSSYATTVVDRLVDKTHPWTSKSVKTKYRSLDDIELGDLAFSKKRGSGVVVHIGSTIVNGKLGIIFIGAPTVQRELEEKLTAILQ